MTLHANSIAGALYINKFESSETPTRTGMVSVCNCNDSGTNLKLAGTGKAPETFFGRVPQLFGSKSTISRFGEHFRDGQYSLEISCWLFYSWCPPFPAICKSGGTCPCALWSRRHGVTAVWSNDDRNKKSSNLGKISAVTVRLEQLPSDCSTLIFCHCSAVTQKPKVHD